MQAKAKIADPNFFRWISTTGPMSIPHIYSDALIGALNPGAQVLIQDSVCTRVRHYLLIPAEEA